jgi:hypothetical protein
MAILAQFTQSGVTPEIYDSIRQEIGWDADTPPGALFHAAAFHDGTIHAIDVWDSEAAMRAYFETRLVPAAQKLGYQVDEPKVYQVHAMKAFAELAALEPAE